MLGISVQEVTLRMTEGMLASRFHGRVYSIPSAIDLEAINSISLGESSTNTS